MLSPQSLPGAVSSETENGLLSFNDSLAISDQWQITPIVRIGANKGYLIFLLSCTPSNSALLPVFHSLLLTSHNLPER